MGFGSSGLAHLAAAKLLFGAIVVSLGGIALLLAFIVFRRWLRGRYFARRDALATFVRSNWGSLIGAPELPEKFRIPGMPRDVLESILLDRIAVADSQELPRFVDC